MSTNKPDEVVSVEYTKGASRIHKSGQKAQWPKTKKTKGKKYNDQLPTKIYDKRDDFNFAIINGSHPDGCH
jgi:hypothetical protein